jgi:type I restriction enzyme S subunit
MVGATALSRKYAAYPEYKDSEVKWLGAIPVSWTMTKMAWNFKAEKGKNGQLLTKDYCGLNSGQHAVYSGQTENDGIMGRINSFEFDTGSDGVLFSTTVGAKAMHLSHLTGKFSLSQNCMIMVPKSKNYHIRFSFYHFQPLFFYERGLIPEHMQASFRMEDLYQYQTVLPSMNEQAQIANFLDHETAKIDTLIDKQQQLITLLKEKRQAVISHAVTKGLNPNAPMRDSGVEWLEEVPVHWEVIRFKHLVAESAAGPYGSSLTKSMYTSAGIRVFGQQQVIPDDFSIGDYYISEEKFEEMKRYEVFPNDLLISVMGTVGKVAVVPEDIERGIINPRLVKYKVMVDRILPHFAKAAFLSDASQSLLLLAAQGSTMDGLNMQILGELPIPCPPTLGEQQEILNETQRQAEKFDKLLVKSQFGVELLRERRTALISSAVTGKIDVRNWQAPTAKSEKEVVA